MIIRLRLVSTIALLFTFCLAVSSANADLVSEGKALYKSGKFAEAAAKFEQATKADPKNAQAWWQLNFAYHKLNKETEALNAVKKASDADPAHNFASDPKKYDQILSDRTAAAGGSPAPKSGGYAPTQAGGTPIPSGGETSDGSGSGNIAAQLTRGDVYVERGMRVDIEQLRATSASLRPTVVKFVVFNSNSNSAQLSREGAKVIEYLKDYLNRGEGYVILTSRRGISVASKGLSRDKIKDLTQQVAPQMEAGQFTTGLVRLAKGLVTTRSSGQPSVTANTTDIPTPRSSGAGTKIMIFFAAIVGIIVVWLGINSIAKKNAMKAMREPLEREKGDVINQMNFLDDQIGVLDPAIASRVREARVSAGSKLDQAVRIMNHAKSETELNQAQRLLDQAQGEIRRARLIIDNPTGAGSSPKSAGVPPVINTSPTTDWNQVPQDDRGVCFFCSRPSRLSELTPVSVNLGNGEQKVLACFDDLQTIKTGQTPQIRAFNQGGQYVPWYASQSYNPYTDYYSRGYGNRSLLSDMIALSVVDSMFWGWHRPMGWGWGGGYGYGGGNSYVFYADNPVYHDYYSHNYGGGGYGGGGGYDDLGRAPNDAAGTDFLGTSGGDSNFGGGDSNSGGGSNYGSDRS
ncbi:MAG: tetratricopeptide repeat protein [Chthonomonadales bacterium]